MLEAAFIILVSGCSHDGATCTPVDRIEVAASTRAACEQQLDAALGSATADWPVFTAECRRADTLPPLLVAELPD
ncbi:hypothetical protein GE300_01190 [Rhodobacteraceae bacterium 2CG4]|uniref:Uncharacterized protein n=1 Tax=Halovulum marinum TaxID=2662447 RepID=A0A6L5YWC5_9RHOB|nr:hypothetical protein [Halovulum marinum]MSU88229.1 hypothetical protein [Halovulum marinum]